MVYDRCDFCKDMMVANAPLDDGAKVDTTSGCFCHDIATLVFKVCMDNIVYESV